MKTHKTDETCHSIRLDHAFLVRPGLYGKEQVRRLLKYELDRYPRQRGGEAMKGLPLARFESQP